MTTLFYSLLTTPKTKRWLMMLDRLEVKAHTGKELAQVLGCTRRTVVSDAKEIKEFFQSTLVLLGDEGGYLIEFKEPRNYYQKKQTLLEKEPLFRMVDDLIKNEERSNQEWAQKLQLPIATYTRMKRQLNQILSAQYGVKLSATTNQILGAEIRIRQFFYDFYFTLPLYPKDLTAQIRDIRTYEVRLPSSKWQLNQRQLQGWLTIAERRMSQGYALPQRKEDLPLCQKLADALDPTHQIAIPEQEKAGVFLAAIEEEQFLRPVIQTEFLYQFSSHDWKTILAMEEMEKQLLLFQTLIRLMRDFFHLPYEKKNSENSKRAEEELLEQMVHSFINEKQRLEQAVSVNYQLIGPPALQRWIKSVVCACLEARGYLVYEGDPSATTRLHVTNRSDGTIRNAEILLSSIPDQAEIANQIKQYDRRQA
ncbi:HTH domain-containing protein [Enterococcus casseliflavus]|uniref:helix-turn-helix domain-containing protein n=1 Tax=Enterococcus casseliflavus TaxID=37734 RepID=UPI0008E86275|nr:helix-turn-helix domain-containing protein [Enterococcus casseliflavus]SFE56981.1 HTH domain-containing protein [Enterococcus casseliflavus]